MNALLRIIKDKDKQFITLKMKKQHKKQILKMTKKMENMLSSFKMEV